MTKLLSVSRDAKTIKGQKQGYLTGVMYLAPFNVSGMNVCPNAVTAKCHEGCLFTAGRAGMSKGSVTFNHNGFTLKDSAIQRARIKRTEWLRDNRQEFLQQLVKEIHALVRKAKRLDLIPVVRLNGTSDLNYQTRSMSVGDLTLFELFSDVQFYDYTKLTNRVSKFNNYHLTYSYSEANIDYANKVLDNLKQGKGNAAVVFRRELPLKWNGYPVVSGDETDLRFKDKQGVIVGLKAKGAAKKDTSGFVVQ